MLSSNHRCPHFIFIPFSVSSCPHHAIIIFSLLSLHYHYHSTVHCSWSSLHPHPPHLNGIIPKPLAHPHWSHLYHLLVLGISSTSSHPYYISSLLSTHCCPHPHPCQHCNLVISFTSVSSFHLIHLIMFMASHIWHLGHIVLSSLFHHHPHHVLIVPSLSSSHPHPLIFIILFTSSLPHMTHLPCHLVLIFLFMHLFILFACLFSCTFKSKVLCHSCACLFVCSLRIYSFAHLFTQSYAYWPVRQLWEKSATGQHQVSVGISLNIH